MPSYFITGANRGIGLALVKRLLQDLESVVVAGVRSPDVAQALHELLVDHSARLILVPFDLADPTKIERAAELSAAFLPDGLDCLISNAAVSLQPVTPFAEINFDLLEEEIRLNCVAPIRVVRAFLPLIRQKRGKVVFLSSVAGSVAQAAAWGETGAAYSMAKASLNIMAKKWGTVLKAEGITTLVLHPGWVDTVMGHDIDEFIAAHYPSVRMISPEECAEGCVKAIRDAKIEDETEFVRYDGERVPW